jgi:hypothetical protein
MLLTLFGLDRAQRGQLALIDVVAERQAHQIAQSLGRDGVQLDRALIS